MCKNKRMEKQFRKPLVVLVIGIFIGMMGNGITLAEHHYLDLSDAVVVSNTSVSTGRLIEIFGISLSQA